ncbi:MAG: PQQ-binding-like beta-propeller repeat protein [Desulfatiglans sp.]|nr:PQQ-binding-like beta-propeller repeat protein [Desulfatiglans sp.]
MKLTSKYMELIPIFLIAAGGAALFSLLMLEGRGAGVSIRMPVPENISTFDISLPFVGELTLSDGIPSEIEGSWPGFRGANLDAILSSNLPRPLNLRWEETPPKVLWETALGEGYAGAAVANGRVYILDYDQEKEGDVIRCLSLDDGREIWRFFYRVKIKRNHGMSRTVPVIVGDSVITLGPKCHVVCLDAITGELRWKRDLVQEDGAEVPAWYAGQCPLVDGDKLILGVGGKDTLLMALDYRTGEIIWKTPNPSGWKMTHSSIVPMDLGTERSYVYCAGGGVTAVSAEDGRLLWSYPEWRINIANVPTPLIIDRERIFLCGGYNAGAMMLSVKKRGDNYVPEPLYRLNARVFGSDQQTPIFYKGHIYGVRPDQQLVCMDLDGNILWTSTSANKFGLGPYTVINDIIFVMDNEGQLNAVKATHEAYQPLTSARVLSGHESWGPMAFVAGRLIVRDLISMRCLDIMKGG